MPSRTRRASERGPFSLPLSLSLSLAVLPVLSEGNPQTRDPRHTAWMQRRTPARLFNEVRNSGRVSVVHLAGGRAPSPKRTWSAGDASGAKRGRGEAVREAAGERDCTPSMRGCSGQPARGAWPCWRRACGRIVAHVRVATKAPHAVATSSCRLRSGDGCRRSNPARTVLVGDPTAMGSGDGRRFGVPWLGRAALDRNSLASNAAGPVLSEGDPPTLGCKTRCSDAMANARSTLQWPRTSTQGGSSRV